MKRLLASLLALLQTGLVPVIAAAATYYVDQGCGNITIYNPAAALGSRCTGGTATSRTTIQAASNLATVGDIVDIRAGTYTEALQIWTKVNVTYRGHVGETVIIRPADASAQGIDIALGSSGLTFSHLKIDGSNLGGTPAKHNIAINGSSNIVFDDIESFDNGQATRGAVGSPGQLFGPGAGAFVNGSNVTFSNCYIHHNGFYANPYSFDGTQAPYGFYWPGSGGTIDNCRVEDNGAYGIQAYPSPSNMTIKNSSWGRNGNNYTDGAGSTGRTSAAILVYGTGANIHHNVIYDAPLQMGISVSGTNSSVYNNTVYNTGQGGIEWFNGISPAIRNNILVNNPSGGHLVNSGGTPTFSNNLCFGTGSTTNCTITGSDPLFVNAAGGDFHLQTGSPAINAGVINITTGVTVPACSGGVTTGCYNGSLPDLGGLETGVPTVAGGPPTLTPSSATVAAGAAILLTVDDDDVNERVENTGDWVGLFIPGATAAVSVDWFYMNGQKTAPASPISDAVIPFTAPSTPGAYEFRFYRDNLNSEADRLATAPITVIAPGIVMKFNISTIKIGPSVTWKIGTP